MSKVITFKKWIKQFEKDEGYVGELARHIANDKNFPATSLHTDISGYMIYDSNGYYTRKNGELNHYFMDIYDVVMRQYEYEVYGIEKYWNWKERMIEDFEKFDKRRGMNEI